MIIKDQKAVKYSFVDFETNKLFRDAPADAPNQARMAEVDIILTDDDLNHLGHYQSYIYPDNWQMTEGASAANGLTDELLRSRGNPIANVVDEITQVLDLEAIWVAFNATFDAKVLRAELRLAGKPDRREKTLWICTRNMALDTLNLSHYTPRTNLHNLANLLDIPKDRVTKHMIGARRDNEISLMIFRACRERDPTCGKPFIITRKKPMPPDSDPSREPMKGR
jgi:DNA polymerase III epsilon subunit-like protein